LGGGGYSIEVVPIAWAIVFQTMRGGEVPEFLPPCWMEMFTNFVERGPFSLPDIPIKLGEGAQRKMSTELENTLRGLKKVLSEVHGIS
jgi:hypothetical protein